MSTNLLIIPTYDLTTIGIAVDIVGNAPQTDPTLTIEVPGFDTVTGLIFDVTQLNIYNSIDLGISTSVETLPDGMYCVTYVETPPATVPPTKKFLRVDKLQEKFDKAFIRLDIMECDKALKKQAKVDLMSIYFFIQGAIASANNCASVEATRLYIQANRMLNAFMKERCGCSGNNYVINFS